MQYLAQWRMQLAGGWLRDTNAKVIEVALEVGYENEAAFSRAFKRAVGESPGAWRRSPPHPPEGSRRDESAGGHALMVLDASAFWTNTATPRSTTEV